MSSAPSAVPAEASVAVVPTLERSAGGATPATQEFRALWNRAIAFKDLAHESDVTLRLDELHAGFRFKIDKYLSPKVLMSHAMEMGGHHPREDGHMAGLGRPPPTSDPSAYEFGMRYNFAGPGNALSAMVRSDGFSTVAADLKLAPWFSLHLAGQFVRDQAASFVIADLRSATSALNLRMQQQTNFEASFSQGIGRRLALGAQLQYDATSFWTSSAVVARLVTRMKDVARPTEVLTLEAGTLGPKEQALSVPNVNEQWTQAQALVKQLGFVNATWWSTFGDNYRVTAAARVQKETEKKWKSSVRLGGEFVAVAAVYKGYVDPFNCEIASEVREEIQPNVVWSMCARVNYWEQTYRFGAGLQFHF